MTNKEIIQAIERIAQIKLIKKEEEVLRDKVISEMKKRGKEKINLGGPSNEDYVKLNMTRIGAHTRQIKSYIQHRLSYRISSDESNMVRGIDL